MPTAPLSCPFAAAVYADGGICLDILQNRWSPTYDVAAILTSIQVCVVCLPGLVPVPVSLFGALEPKPF